MKLLVGRFFGLLAVVLLALQPATVEAQHGNAARLTVHRSRTSAMALPLFSMSMARRYDDFARTRYDGVLSPGRHVLTATVAPNVMMSRTFQRAIDVQAGRTYSFTAKWMGTDVVLVPNT